MSRIRERFYGNTVEEWIAKVPGELAVDAVGLWQIVSFGRQGFELSGDELADYVRRNLLALFAKGAKPVIGAFDGTHFWTLLNYGDRPEEMANAIIEEWLRSGCDPDAGGVWFALPHVYQARRTDGTPGKTRANLKLS
jgi:hypothetical protein